MFYNGANCDIYIGKGAGKKLLDDINNAKSSIKIVSPYLSPFLISQLIKLHKRNLHVELITSDSIEDFYGKFEKNIYKLIIQNRETNDEALEKRQKWKKLIRNLSIVLFASFITIIGAYYILRDYNVILGLIPIFVLIMAIVILKKIVNNMSIYTYWYSQLFPFKVFITPEGQDSNGTFIHSKIYLIDGEIAYLGSLNFTKSGTKYNYETRIRTIDPIAIKKINEELSYLFNHSNLQERNIQLWGKQLYDEPIN